MNNEAEGRTVNKVILVGVVGADADVRSTGDGKSVAHLSLATRRYLQSPDGSFVGRTDWHRVTLNGFWATKAEREIRRGMRVYVEGHIEYGSYDRDGVSIPTADIIANDCIILNGREP